MKKEGTNTGVRLVCLSIRACIHTEEKKDLFVNWRIYNIKSQRKGDETGRDSEERENFRWGLKRQGSISHAHVIQLNEGRNAAST